MNMVKGICDAQKIPLFPAAKDKDLIDAITVIRRMTTGDVATLPPYGRGVDIRFKTDSVVVIGFLPSRMEQVRQMAGRISRSLCRDRFLIVCEQPHLTPDTLENRPSGLDFFSVKSGIRVTKVMRGRRRAAQTDDRSLHSVFKKGWLTDVGKLKNSFYKESSTNTRGVGLTRIVLGAPRT